MKEWINREVSGEGLLTVFIFVGFVYSIGWMITTSVANDRYRIEKGVVEVKGYMKVSDLKYIIQEEK